MTPPAIFGLSSTEMTMPALDVKKKLKDTYARFVKLYHPDVSGQKVIVDAKGKILSQEEKNARFLEVQSAYELLKSTKRRLAYNRYSTTSWNHTKKQTSRRDEWFSDENFRRFQQANANRFTHSFRRNEQFWTAGTWEDYYRMRHNRAPPTREQVQKNKYQILVVVLAIGGLVCSLQIMTALDASLVRRLALAEEYRKSAADLEQSRSNFGEGDLAASRLERFLVSRRLVMPDTIDLQYSTSMRNPFPAFAPKELAPVGTYLKEDDLLMTEYARRRVSKWDQDNEATGGVK